MAPKKVYEPGTSLTDAEKGEILQDVKESKAAGKAKAAKVSEELGIKKAGAASGSKPAAGSGAAAGKTPAAAAASGDKAPPAGSGVKAAKALSLDKKGGGGKAAGGKEKAAGGSKEAKNLAKAIKTRPRSAQPVPTRPGSAQPAPTRNKSRGGAGSDDASDISDGVACAEGGVAVAGASGSAETLVPADPDAGKCLDLPAGTSSWRCTTIVTCKRKLVSSSAPPENVIQKVDELRSGGHVEEANKLKQCGKAGLSQTVMAAIMNRLDQAFAKGPKLAREEQKAQNQKAQTEEKAQSGQKQLKEHLSEADQLQAQGAPRELKLRVDTSDEIIEATLTNGWVSDHELLSERHSRWAGPMSSKTYQVQIGSEAPITARIGRCIEYAPSERLLVLVATELVAAELVDATVTERARSVGNRHHLQLRDGSQIEVDLNPWNHAIPRFESADTFFEARDRYVTEQLSALSTFQDAITGNHLKVEEQLIFIGTKEAGTQGVRRAGWNDAGDMKALADLLAASSPARSQGTHDSQSVLMLAGPGTGKTWSTQQLAYLLLQKARASSEALPPLPLLVRVQRMLAVLKSAGVDVTTWDDTSGGPSLLEEYIKAAFEDGAVRDALLQAYALRSLVVIIDGADEAAAMRTPVETLVLRRLEPMRVVLSSRPQDLNGVDVSRFEHFVIMDLKPLSEEQQRQAISNQLKDSESFEHLAAFGKIRREHDRIFEEVAFPDEKERDEIERFEQRNLFFASDGKRDPSMRQRSRDGSGFVRFCKADEPKSAYLCQLCGFFSAPLLIELSAALLNLEQASVVEAAVKAAVAGLKSNDDVQRLRAEYGEQFFDLEDDPHAEPKRHDALKQDSTFKALKLAVKLGLLLLKRHGKEPALTLEVLWERVWRRTDDVFVATEDLKQTFEDAVRQFATALGLTEKDIKFGPLKDPVRIHEKALDDYIHDFDDWNDAIVIPEACVVDVLRVRVVVQNGQQMLALQRLLRDGFEVTLIGYVAATLLRLVRAKNKLSTTMAEERGLAGLDPTHFRNILNNVQLIHDGRTVFAEVQVHHAAILEYNDESHAHDHYNFFRARLADNYGHELDAMLERAILFFEEVSGNPVLLSMLVLVFSGGSNSESLPASKSELYIMATRAALRKRLAPPGTLDRRKSGLERQPSSLDSQEVEPTLRILWRIAIAAHLAEKREFTGRLVQEAISSAELRQWNTMLADARGIPLVKIIEAGALAGGTSIASSFQFAHLSFQEGLFAQALADGSAADAVRKRFGSSHRKLLDNPWFLNALTIGGSAVGVTLKVDDAKLELGKEEVNAMVATQWAPLGSERLSLELRFTRDVEEKTEAEIEAEHLRVAGRTRVLIAPRKVKAVNALATYLTSTRTVRNLEYAPAKTAIELHSPPPSGAYTSL